MTKPVFWPMHVGFASPCCAVEGGSFAELTFLNLRLFVARDHFQRFDISRVQIDTALF